MDAHALETALPVEEGRDGLARRGQGLALGRHMDEAALVFGIVDGGADGDHAAVGQAQMPEIAGLAAARRIEDRPVEDDAAAVVDGFDRRRRLFQIGILAEEQFGRHGFIARW